MRGFAILYILLFHVVYIPSPNLDLPPYLGRFASLGGGGVGLFFLLSAFTLSLSRKQRGKEQNGILNFYVRRFFRIVPLFYVWLFVSCLRTTFLFDGYYSWKLIALNIFFGFNFFPGKHEGIVWASWPLPVEMIFYLFFPLLLRGINTLYRAILLICLALLTAAIFQQAISLLNLPETLRDSFFQFSIIRHIPVFAAGMFGFMVFDRFIRVRKGSDIEAYGLLIVSIIAYFLLAAFPSKSLFWSWYLHCAVYLALLLSLALRPFAAFVNPVTTFYGRISYSVYLNHPWVVFLLIPVYRWLYSAPIELFPSFLACFASTLAIVTPISYFTYRFVEVPGRELGGTLIRRLQGRRSTQVVVV